MDALIKALGDSEVPGVRASAAKGLGPIGDVRAVEPLTEKLSDPDGNVSRDAAIALGAIGDARAVDALIKALGDSTLMFEQAPPRASLRSANRR